MTGEALIIIACGSRKLDHPARAEDLYVGSYYRLCMKAARTLAAQQVGTVHMRILSARHGLLRLSDVVAPYRQRLPLGKLDGDLVALIHRQAAAAELGDAVVTVVGGRPYVDVVSAAWGGVEPSWPLRGCQGIGEQQAVLKAICQGQSMTEVR